VFDCPRVARASRIASMPTRTQQLGLILLLVALAVFVVWRTS
jgi:hypothetical protein